MQVKIFEFQVSNSYGGNATGAYGCWKEKFNKNELVSTTRQENQINKFLVGKTIKDVKVDTYILQHHNNGGCDTQIVRYTFFYE